MKQTINVKLLILAGGLALGAACPAFAQTTATTPPEANFGLLGSNYVGLDYGYYHLDQPSAPTNAHQYGAFFNQNVQPGLDLSLSYDELRASALGANVRSDELLAGITGYAPVNAWLKPFLSAQAGFDWTQSLSGMSGGDYNTVRGTHFDYVLTAGGEFQVLRALVLTPFAAYQEVHGFDRDWNYGLKATYRLTRNWSVSLTPQIDEHHNLAYLGAVNYHF